MNKVKSLLAAGIVAGALFSSSSAAHADVASPANQARAAVQPGTQQRISRVAERDHIATSASSGWYVYAWYFTSVQCEYYGALYQLEGVFNGWYCAASLPLYGPDPKFAPLTYRTPPEDVKRRPAP